MTGRLQPFNMDTVTKRQLRATPCWKLTLPCSERQAILGDYVERLLNGTCGYGSPSLRSLLRGRATSFRFNYDRVVMKILRAQDLINWFEERFSAKIVYLIRHPIPVSLSRESYARLPLFLENERFCERFLKPDSIRFATRILHRGSELERKVLDWTLQNLPPLRSLTRSNWCCVHYEYMVLRPEEVLERLAAYLDLRDLEAARRRVGQPSKTVSKSDQETRRFFAGSVGQAGKGFLIEKWRRRVTQGDLARVQEILDVFEIDTYRADSFLPVNPLSNEEEK